MSLAAYAWAWAQPLLPSEKLVLLRLASHADAAGGNVYPGIRSVAEYTGLSERQVRRHIRRFVETGYLAVESNAQGGRGKMPHYRFTCLKVDTGGHRQHRKADTGGSKGGHRQHRKADTGGSKGGHPRFDS